jgi:cell cycle sensor histidine kinase DivJ
MAPSIWRSWSAAFVSWSEVIRRQVARLVEPVATNPPPHDARRQWTRRRGDLAGATLYKVLAETIGDLVLRHDSSGAVLSASGDAQVLFGLDIRDLIGSGFFDRLHVSDRPAFLQALSAARQREGPICVTLRLRSGSQAALAGDLAAPVFAWAETRLHRLADPAADDREAGAVVSVVRNVTSAKSNEEKLEAARAEAESASSWKDRLLANVSHELRTPLNAIIGFSEILGSDQLAPEERTRQLEYAGIIHASAEHLLSVVNMILDMSKIEAGRFAIAPERFDAAPAIAACCDMLRLRAAKGGVELVRAPLEGPAELIADKRAFRQIVINILSNAVKFTKPLGRVTIGAVVDGGWIDIYVEDTGIGIAPGHLPKLGAPFFQVRSSYDRTFEGTGLGLSLVRGLLGLHGGSLLIESAIEEGTRVTVRLPLDCRGKAQSDAAPAPIEAVSRATRSLPGPPTSVLRGAASPRAAKEKKSA